MGQVLLVAVSGVGGDFLGIDTLHRPDVGEQRRQRRAGICRARLQALGNDDLMRTIDGDLGVIAGNHGISLSWAAFFLLGAALRAKASPI